jgi:hypothetical protein
VAAQHDVGDEVRLAIPATPEFVRLARVTASGVAGRMGLTYDEVEDLRLAIDELCFALIGNTGRNGTVRLCYSVQADALVIAGSGEFDDDGRAPALPEFSRQILAALVDDYAVYRDEHGRAAFRLVKSRVHP